MREGDEDLGNHQPRQCSEACGPETGSTWHREVISRIRAEKSRVL